MYRGELGQYNVYTVQRCIGHLEVNVNDHTLFLQHEIDIAFVDDFMVLPAEQIIGNVFIGLTPAVERHDLMFAFVH